MVKHQPAGVALMAPSLCLTSPPRAADKIVTAEVPSARGGQSACIQRVFVVAKAGRVLRVDVINARYG